MHGWCAEKENRGKGGSGKGKIGAGVGSCQSMDPVGIPSGPSRAPIFAFLGTAFGQSGSSRDPVGIHSRDPGPNRAPIFAFLGAAFGHSGSSRDPVGIQSGTNFRIFGTTFGPVGKQPKSPKNMQKHCKNAIFYEFGCLPTLVPDCDWVPTGSRLDPDPVSSKKTPISLNLSTYF